MYIRFDFGFSAAKTDSNKEIEHPWKFEQAAKTNADKELEHPRNFEKVLLISFDSARGNLLLHGTSP